MNVVLHAPNSPRQLNISALEPRPTIKGEVGIVDLCFSRDRALPVKVIILQLISHGPLIIILEVHHHSQHLGNWRHNT